MKRYLKKSVQKRFTLTKRSRDALYLHKSKELKKNKSESGGPNPNFM